MKKSEPHTRHPFLGTRDQIGIGLMDASFQLISASGWSMVQDSVVLMALEYYKLEKTKNRSAVTARAEEIGQFFFFFFFTIFFPFAISQWVPGTFEKCTPQNMSRYAQNVPFWTVSYFVLEEQFSAVASQLMLLQHSVTAQ